MRKNLSKLLAATLLLAALPLGARAQDTITHKIFDAVTFYDGYRVKDFSAGIDSTAGVLHHTTYLYATRLTDDVLDNIGDSLALSVVVGARCDNYDRLGNINLALVPKGDTIYDADSVQRLELGRFITPFMNKNKQPDTVPYAYRMDYLSPILRDARLREQYDLWMEFELFGVPYAANTQVKGCSGRNDVFQGTLSIVTNGPALPQTTTDVLVPIHIKGPEWRSDRGINNYSEACTDTLGKTTKTFYFDVPEDCTDAHIVLVTSNHGSNSGGEEYNRRWHYIYYDGELALSYIPGRTSCEPFRKYNTQSNGIYGLFKRSDETWQSFSNWCPGDVIDNRIITLGAVKAGQHSLRVSVPDAVFADSQGYFPVSLFFQGTTEGLLTPVRDLPAATTYASVSQQGDLLTVQSEEGVMSLEVYSLQGQRLRQTELQRTVSVAGLPSGIYLVNVELTNHVIETHKMYIR